MGRYKIVFRQSVSRDLRAIPKQDLRRILVAINALSEKPRPAAMETLSGQEKCRVRQGNYRIIYETRDDEVVVVVVKVGHRKDVYRR